MTMKKFLVFFFLSFSFFIVVLLCLFLINRSEFLGINLSEFLINKVSLIQKPRNVSVILAGDVMLGRSVLIKSLDQENDPNYPFMNVSNYLSTADFVFANLESPIILDCPRFEHGYTFCTDSKMVEGLVSSGIDVVNLANNHILNFGKEGLEDTKKYLYNSNISYTGIGNLVIREIENTSFGFLGFDFTVNIPTEEDWSVIKESDSKVDVLIIGVHWGEEYKEKANNNQRAWAKKMVESGADVVSGHHPHWVEDYEYIDGKPVFYSLGNFIFDQMWSEETKKGLLVKLTFENGKMVSEEFKHTYMESTG